MKKKQEILTGRNTLVRQMKSFIETNLDTPKVNMIDPTKDNITQLITTKKILDKLEISRDNHYRALSISKDDRISSRGILPYFVFKNLSCCVLYFLHL